MESCGTECGTDTLVCARARAAAVACLQLVVDSTRLERAPWASVGHPPYPGGTPTVPQWDTHRTPVGHPQCPSGTRTVPQWDTHRAPVGHTPCPSGAHTVSQWGTRRVPVGYTPYPSGAHTVSQWDTHRVPAGYPPCPTWHPRILMLDKRKAIATIPNHRIQVRKNEDSGGCRRYGRAGKAHQTCTGAGVEFFSSCRGLPRCVHASGIHQPEVSARRRDFQPVAARTCRRVVNVTSGLTARVRRKCHGYPCR